MSRVKTDLKKQIKDPFLFEMGVEEIPSAYLVEAEASLAQAAEQLLKESGMGYTRVQCFSTPRRFALWIEGLVQGQTLEAKEIVGPTKEIAFDQKGEPTAALLGFLKSNGLGLKDITFKDTPKGPKVVARVRTKFRPIRQLLPELLVKLVGMIRFPKTMRWDETGLRFARPIRWLLALWGREVISVQLGSLKTGRLTWGHRFLANRAVSISSSTDYLKRLPPLHVVLDREKRKDRIRKLILALAGRNQLSLHTDEELVETVANLVEEPFAVLGQFRKEYLSLPSDVLATCMKKNQKIFACYNRSGKLVNRFIAVMNGKRGNLEGIRRDYEDVLEARLRDAQFFFKEDTQTPLEKKVPKLKEIVFLGKCGNVLERTERLVSLSRFLAGELHLSSDQVKHCERAARLCKADLVTHMVYEFPELQGVMGGEYARCDGETGEVCLAISRHYLPRSLGEGVAVKDIQKELAGAVLSICDKADILVAAFGTGVELSGSEDPYALRRAAGGIVKRALAYDLRFSLSKLIGEAHRLLSGKLTVAVESIQERLRRTFRERILFAFESLQLNQKEQELLQAILASGFDDLVNVKVRFDQLRKLAQRDAQLFFQSCKVVERTENILKGLKGPIPEAVDPQKFQDPLESELHQLIERFGPAIEAYLQKEQFDTGIGLYGKTFYEVVDQFFSKVLVNVDDQAVRANRQALMKRLNRIVTQRCANLALVESVVSIRLAKTKER